MPTGVVAVSGMENRLHPQFYEKFYETVKDWRRDGMGKRALQSLDLISIWPLSDMNTKDT